MAETPQPGAAAPFGATVTILFSDIRGFTEYTDRYGDEAAFRILQEHNALLRQQLEAFRGNVVKTQGDSFMVSFTTARGAILCAVAIQQALAHPHQDPGGPRIAVGVGINTGEPIQEGGDFFGTTVNLAARICTAAGPGQILISETTRYVAGRLEAIEYLDRGLHELKGFQEPQRLYEVAWGSPGARDRAAAQAFGTAEAESAALESAVHRAIGVLNRVLAVSHQDDPTFGPLLECQAKASELRLALSRVLTERRGAWTVRRVDEAILPFADVLTLVLRHEHLDDQRWTELEASVSRAFGRQLTVAASRGRLDLIEGVTPATPEVPGREASGGSGGLVVEAVAPPPLDPRAGGVRWWASAHRAWAAWKASGMAWAHALRAELARHPHLLSVPLVESAEHDDGRLAAGYFLLLEHVENRSPAFMRTAVAQAVEAAGGAVEPPVLGRKLYELLVSQGRLGETYADFVRDVMVVTIPNPGVWADGGVVENEETTVVVRRPGPVVGDPQEAPEHLSEPGRRAAPHRFTVILAPLTARFFHVRAGELRSLREVEICLIQGGAPSAHAWYLVERTGHVLHSEPRRLGLKGVTLAGLGRDYAGIWIGVFNPAPDRAAEHELAVSVRMPAPPMARRSPFSTRGLRPR